MTKLIQPAVTVPLVAVQFVASKSQSKSQNAESETKSVAEIIGDFSKNLIQEIDSLRDLYLRHQKTIARLEVIRGRIAIRQPPQDEAKESAAESRPQRSRRGATQGTTPPAMAPTRAAAAAAVAAMVVDTEANEYQPPQKERRSGSRVVRDTPTEETVSVSRSNCTKVYVCETCHRTFTHGPAFSQHTRYHLRDNEQESDKREEDEVDVPSEQPKRSDRSQNRKRRR